MAQRARQPTHPGKAFKNLALPELNMTQAELAEYVGINRVSMNLVLNGRARVTPRIAAKLGELVGSDGALYLRMQNKLDLWKLQNERSGN